MEQYEKLYLYKRIVRAKLFIDDHYAENIDIDNIADQASFSKYHFIRLFKSIYGKTPHNYLIKVRIDKAKLLLSADVSVLETSMAIGFDSPTSFTAVFKKLVRKTPSEFQKDAKMRNAAINQNPFLFVPNCYAETNGWIK